MKNTAKYAWSFSRNSSFLRGLFYYAAHCRCKQEEGAVVRWDWDGYLCSARNASQNRLLTCSYAASHINEERLTDTTGRAALVFVNNNAISG